MFTSITAKTHCASPILLRFASTAYGKNFKLDRHPGISIVSRSCGLYQILGFPKFGSLPRQLQLKIWEFASAVPEKQIVRLETPPQLEGKACKFICETWVHRTLTYKTPAILHVCFNVRSAALERYPADFHQELGGLIYFDFETDLIEFGDLSALDTFFRLACNNRLVQRGTTAWVDKVDTISIRIRDDGWDRSQALTYACKTFQRLKRIDLHITDKWLTSNGSFYPEPVPLPHVLARPKLPTDGDDTTPILHDSSSHTFLDLVLRDSIGQGILDLGGDRDKWTAPTIAITKDISGTNAFLAVSRLSQLSPLVQIFVSFQYIPGYGERPRSRAETKLSKRLAFTSPKDGPMRNHLKVAKQVGNKRRKVKQILMQVLPDICGPTWSLSQKTLDLKLHDESE